MAELRSDNPLESQSLLRASMRSYSPRSAGIMPDDSRMLVISKWELPEFIEGVESDVDIPEADKTTLCLLARDFLAGKITDEAYA